MEQLTDTPVATSEIRARGLRRRERGEPAVRGCPQRADGLGNQEVNEGTQGNSGMGEKGAIAESGGVKGLGSSRTRRLPHLLSRESECGKPGAGPGWGGCTGPHRALSRWDFGC